MDFMVVYAYVASLQLNFVIDVPCFTSTFGIFTLTKAFTVWCIHFATD